MNTPDGMMIVITTIARPDRTMQAMYSRSIALRYWALMGERGAKKGPPQFSLRRPSLRTGLLRVPDALDQRGVLGAVLVAHRLGRLEEGFLVGRHELHARGLQLAGGLADVRVPELALLELRLARE